jgi:hypothetical protein
VQRSRSTRAKSGADEMNERSTHGMPPDLAKRISQGEPRFDPPPQDRQKLWRTGLPAGGRSRNNQTRRYQPVRVRRRLSDGGATAHNHRVCHRNKDSAPASYRCRCRSGLGASTIGGGALPAGVKCARQGGLAGADRPSAAMTAAARSARRPSAFCGPPGAAERGSPVRP